MMMTWKQWWRSYDELDKRSLSSGKTCNDPVILHSREYNCQSLISRSDSLTKRRDKVVTQPELYKLQLESNVENCNREHFPAVKFLCELTSTSPASELNDDVNNKKAMTMMMMSRESGQQGKHYHDADKVEEPPFQRIRRGLEMMEGPSFLRVSAPSSGRDVMDFYNNTGLELFCSAKGRPTPTVSWMTSGRKTFNSGNNNMIPVTEVPGLRHLRRDSSLLLLPFPHENYSQDVHSTTYYCVASNSIGSVISHDIRVRAGKFIWNFLFLFFSLDCFCDALVSCRRRQRFTWRVFRLVLFGSVVSDL